MYILTNNSNIILLQVINAMDIFQKCYETMCKEPSQQTKCNILIEYNRACTSAGFTALSTKDVCFFEPTKTFEFAGSVTSVLSVIPTDDGKVSVTQTVTATSVKTPASTSSGAKTTQPVDNGKKTAASPASQAKTEEPYKTVEQSKTDQSSVTEQSSVIKQSSKTDSSKEPSANPTISTDTTDNGEDSSQVTDDKIGVPVTKSKIVPYSTIPSVPGTKTDIPPIVVPSLIPTVDNPTVSEESESTVVSTSAAPLTAIPTTDATKPEPSSTLYTDYPSFHEVVSTTNLTKVPSKTKTTGATDIVKLLTESQNSLSFTPVTRLSETKSVPRVNSSNTNSILPIVTG